MDILAHPVTKLVIATGIGLWAGFDWTFRALVLLMTLDIVLGVMRAAKERRLSSTCSRDGLMVKAATIILVLVVEILERTVNVELISVFFPSLGNLNMPASELACIWFCKTEIVSIWENASQIGVRLPPWIKEGLAKLREEQGSASAGDDR